MQYTIEEAIAADAMFCLKAEEVVKVKEEILRLQLSVKSYEREVEQLRRERDYAVGSRDTVIKLADKFCHEAEYYHQELLAETKKRQELEREVRNTESLLIALNTHSAREDKQADHLLKRMVTRSSAKKLKIELE